MELCIVIPFLKDPHYQMYYIMNSFLSQVIVALLTLCIVIPFLKDPHYQMYYIMNSFLFQVIVVEFLELYTLYSQYVISLWKKQETVTLNPLQ